MADRSWMDAEERAEFEQNRDELIERAWGVYRVRLKVDAFDDIRVKGELSAIVDFYGGCRSEIEEML